METNSTHCQALETGPATVGGFLRTSLDHKRTRETAMPHVHCVEGRKLIKKAC